MPRPNPLRPVRRVIDTCLWSDAKVVALGPPKSSPLMLFIFLCTHPNSGRIPGVLVESVASIAGRLHWKLETTKEMLHKLTAQGLVYFDPANWLVWIPNAIKYNAPAGAAEVALWAKEWRGLQQCPLKDRIATELGEFLAGRPLLAAAFAQHCLGQPVAVPEAPAAPKPASGKKSAGKTTEQQAQWEAEFEALWPSYPKRAGGSTKKEAKTGFIARRRDDKMELAEITAGVERYARYCEGMGIVRTAMVMQAMRFFRSADTIRDEYPLAADRKITHDLATHPDFERVLAAYPRQDGKADAWKMWQRIDPAPDTTLVARMLVSIAEWKKFQWGAGKEAFIQPLAKWLESMGWNRRFKQNGSASFEATAARFGAAKMPGAGNVYEGEVVAPTVTPVLPFTRPSRPEPDPFDLTAVPARR